MHREQLVLGGCAHLRRAEEVVYNESCAAGTTRAAPPGGTHAPDVAPISVARDVGTRTAAAAP